VLTAAAAIFLAAYIVLRLIRLPRRRMPYVLCDSLLTNAELDFYRALRQVVDSDSTLVCKVRMLDILELPRGVRERQAWLNKVSAKHVDFLVCSRETFKPRLAIELDDSSHDREDRKTRDAFVNEAFAAAGLPLLRVRAQRGYNIKELSVSVDASLAPIDSDRPGHTRRLL
jgi:very-short-patch-repair endonuclease